MTHQPVPHCKDEVGKRLRLLRAAMDNMAQKDFAELIDASSQKLANWEAGLHYISVDAAVKVCIKTSATFDYIFRGHEGELSPTLRANLRKAKKFGDLTTLSA